MRVSAYDCDAAFEMAYDAHWGQLDKAGMPYIYHPMRVSFRLRALRYGHIYQSVAYLHDVVEDTGVTLDDIEYNFGLAVRNAVDALTKRKGESNDDYYARVKDNPVALVVKKADIADNTDPARLEKLDEATRKRLTAKYAHALEVLNA